jgi:hypothetical protein
MNTTEILDRIDYADDKIENIERCGCFTESEIDRAIPALYQEREFYKMHLKNALQNIEVIDFKIL